MNWSTLLHSLLICLFLGVMTSGEAIAQEIDFRADKTKGCAPTSIYFKADNIPAGSILYWDFGNGPEAGGDSVLTVFKTPGSHTIRLVAIFPDGTRKIIEKQDYIKVGSNYEPKLKVVKDTGDCSDPFRVTLTDLTPGSISRRWTLDGKVLKDTSRTITYSFSRPGLKSVILEAKDAGGCGGTLYLPNHILIEDRIIVDFGARMHEQADGSMQVTFAPALTNDSLFLITKYEWSFPGGTPSVSYAKVPPMVTYANPHAGHDVTLRVSTSQGCTYSFTKNNLIRKHYELHDEELCLLKIGKVTTPGDSLYYYNGIKMSLTDEVAKTATAEDTFIFRFTQFGYSDLSLGFSYKGSAVQDSLFSHKELIKAFPPVAGFTSDVLVKDIVPTDVTFEAENWQVPFGTNTYTWYIYRYLGDQNNPGVLLHNMPIYTGSDHKLTYHFTDSGIYSVKLVVHNTMGCSDSIMEIGYAKLVTPRPGFSLSENELCVNTPLIVTSQADPKDHRTNPYMHSYTFTHRTKAGVKVKGNGFTDMVTFTVPGIYDVKYVVDNNGFGSDSLIKKQAVRVNGAVISFEADKKEVFVGGYTTLQSTISDIYPKALPNEIKYFWKITPSDSVTIENPNSPFTKVYFHKPGLYSVTLAVTTKEGCTSISSKLDYIVVGTKADFSFTANICREQYLQLTNTSTLRPTSFKWTANSPDVTFYPSDTLANPRVKFAKDGCYELRLVTSKLNDSRYESEKVKEVCITTPEANFETTDTVLHCAPVLATFKNTSKNAVRYKWMFGDGHVATSETGVNEYKKNRPEGYDVTLIAFNANGCSDTITRRSYVKVWGPVPDFDMQADSNCGSVNVKFTNKSKYCYVVAFDPRNGGTPNANVDGTYTFEYKDFSYDKLVFNPLLVTRDDSGCVAYAEKTLVLYRPSIPKFELDKTSGCLPLTVTARNLSQYGSKYYWDFNNDGAVDATTENASYTFTKAGVYQVVMVAESEHGCRSEYRMEVRVNGVVKMTPTVNMTNTCFGEATQFALQPEKHYPVARYSWDFGDKVNDNSDTSNAASPTYRYRTPGKHTVKVLVVDAFGCSQTITFQAPDIRDTIRPDAPELHYVTVNTNNQVEVNWVIRNDDHFAYAKVFHKEAPNASGNEKATITRPDQTNLVDGQAQPSVAPQGYVLGQWDECGRGSDQSTFHRTIHLQAASNAPNTVTLNWTRYVGWDEVRQYVLYRSKDEGSFEVIATLSGEDTSYIDQNLCDRDYDYVVEALSLASKGFASRSNTVTIRPKYEYQSVALDLFVTTVKDNVYTQTTWSEGNGSAPRTYVINRYDDRNGWINGYAQTKGTMFIDSAVKVSEYAYRYEVKVLDGCGNISPISNPGTSVLLKGKMQEERTHLSWSAYEGWNEGVSTYLIERMENGRFIMAAMVSGNKTEWVSSTDYGQSFDSAMTFRVLAIRNGKADTSVSNYIHVSLPSRIFMPNAFSPNGDDRNDVLKPVGMMIDGAANTESRQYSFSVFNRWGELIFSTNDMNEGWDGTYRGADSPEGSYVYKINAAGADGNNFFLSGSVTLIR